jgi:hypothetical protein
LVVIKAFVSVVPTVSPPRNGRLLKARALLFATDRVPLLPPCHSEETATDAQGAADAEALWRGTAAPKSSTAAAMASDTDVYGAAGLGAAFIDGERPGRGKASRMAAHTSVYPSAAAM